MEKRNHLLLTNIKKTMRKFTSFLFVLFMAMLVKAQTEAVTTTYDFEDGNKVFVDRSKITSSIVAESGYDGSSALLFTCDGKAQNAYSFSNFDISSLVGNPKTVTISLQYYNTNGGRAILSIGDASVRGTTGNSSRMTYNNKGVIFALGSEKNYAFLNGSKPALSAYCNKWLDVSVTVNVIEKTYSYSIKESATSSMLSSAENIAYYNSDALECTQIDLFGCINNNQCARIDNLVITVEPDDRPYADYSVAYVDESGNELKEKAVYNGLVGDPATLTEADKVAFKNSDNTKKYIYKSDDAADKTIANDGSAVVTVTFREAETYNYTVNAVDDEDNILETIVSDSNFEDDPVNAYCGLYIFKEGVLYEKSNYSNYGVESFTLSTDDMTIDVAYSVSSLANPVYFSEAEDIEGLTKQEDSYTRGRMSKGAAGYATALTTITTLPAGIYTLTSATRSGTTKFYAASDSVFVITSGGSTVTDTSGEFTLYETTEIKVSAGSKSNYFDYMLINRVGDAPARELVVTEGADFAPEYGYYTNATYTRSIAASKYGTICLPFAPDAASLEAYNFYELTASTVSGTDGEVTFTKVDAPEANKPYIYCLADKDATEAPAITGGATEVSTEAGTTIINGWQMVGSFTNQTVDCTDKAIYALNGTTQRLMKVTQSLSVPAYRAYIEGTSSQLDLQMLTVRISGPTGIEQISAADVEGLLPATIYDLMGRPVQNPQKGHLYIQGGKKVVY